MKSNNPYQAPETVPPRHPVGGPNYFVIVFWALIPVSLLIANFNLKRYYDGLGIELPEISKYILSLDTPFYFAVPAAAVILAMIRIPPGKLRFWLAALALLFGSMVILVCILGCSMPWISWRKGQLL